MKRINITCPVCGSKAYLRPASVVYGDKAPDPDAKYYVCGRYPACDCYVAAHRKTMLPMGTLADKALRKKRHDAHVALDSLWKNGIMSRKEAYNRPRNCRKASCVTFSHTRSSPMLMCAALWIPEVWMRTLTRVCSYGFLRQAVMGIGSFSAAVTK